MSMDEDDLLRDTLRAREAADRAYRLSREGTTKVDPRLMQEASAGRDGGQLADIGLARAGEVGGAVSDNFPRYMLEHHRDQLRRQADDVQALLDVLPAKLPRKAVDALTRLFDRK